MSKRTVSFFLLSILTYTSSYALLWDASKREVCEWTPHPERVTVRHIEAKGVGYGQGYTTLEAFLTAPSQLDSPWFPFLDLRGHVFNNGKLASNLGLGLRYTSLSRVWGINSYYDFRQNSHRNFNQYGFGLESLGRVWDFRINGYLPFGKKQSSYYDTHFGDFKGHYLYLSQKRVIAFKGANAEAGVHAKVSDNVTFYAAAGPYVIGHRARNAWGGEGRIAFDFTKYVRLEGNASYDRIFKGIVQGQLSINIPFGPRQSIAPEKPNSCSKQLMLCDRMLQRVDRDEIIVLEKRRYNKKAIDPATGLPYYFIFVDNASHSLGTYESPYPTLTQAEANSTTGNIIYVFPGTGAAYTDQNIILQDQQKVWGSGIAYQLQTTKGKITIPAQSAAMPLVAYSVASITPGITLGNGCEIAGLNFSATASNSNIIQGGPISQATQGITSAYIHDNVMAVGTGVGVELLNCQGNLIIKNNQISGSNVGIDLNNAIVAVSSNVTISNNTVSSFSQGITMELGTPSGTVNLLMANNTLTNNNGGITIVNTNSPSSATLCGAITGNVITGSASDAVFLHQVNNQSTFRLNITNNSLVNNSGVGLNATASGGGGGNPTACLSIVNNSAAMIIGGGYDLTQSTSAIFDVENVNLWTPTNPYQNTGYYLQSGTITNVSPGTCSCP